MKGADVRIRMTENAADTPRRPSCVERTLGARWGIYAGHCQYSSSPAPRAAGPGSMDAAGAQSRRRGSIGASGGRPGPGGRELTIRETIMTALATISRNGRVDGLLPPLGLAELAAATQPARLRRGGPSGGTRGSRKPPVARRFGGRAEGVGHSTTRLDRSPFRRGYTRREA